MANRKSKPTVSQTTNLNVRVSTDLLNAFRRTVAVDETNVSVELRRFMRERVKEHEAEQEPAA